MAEHNVLGHTGEDDAADYLAREGYHILDRNWRSGHKEIDIVAEKGGVLVIVEVKTRRDARFGKPEDAVSENKIRRIVLAADAYVRLYRIDMPVRFDIITVLGKYRQINHIIDAFRTPVWNGARPIRSKIPMNARVIGVT